MPGPWGTPAGRQDDTGSSVNKTNLSLGLFAPKRQQNKEIHSDSRIAAYSNMCSGWYIYIPVGQ